MKFLVELEPGVFIAPWAGDPGRTLIKASASRFDTKEQASAAIDRASDYREWRAPAVVPVDEI